MGNTLVSIVIVNWNGKRFLGDCLAALESQTYTNHEVIFVDNASTDGSAEFVTDHYPQVRILQCDSNLGFAGANNIGFQAAKGTLLATLNNDTRPDPLWLAELVAAMEVSSDVGMCASRLMMWNNPAVIDSAGIAIGENGIAWDRHGGMIDADEDLHPVEVFGPCAGAALYRRELITQTGGFDEAFFLYLEDVDLAWRAQWLGWRCLYVPTAKVLHFHSGSSAEGSALKQYHLGRNKVWMLYKNLPRAHLAWLALITGFDLMAMAYSVYLYHNLAGIRGRIAGICGIRKGIVHNNMRNYTNAQLCRWTGLLEPIEPPWLFARRFGYLRAYRQLGGKKKL